MSQTTRRLAALVVVVVAGAFAAAASAAGTAPANTAPPTISGQTQDGKTLTASPGTWSGTQPITYAYQWQRCEGTGANCSDVANATSNTYTLTANDRTYTFRVKVTATNSAGSASSTSAATSAVTGPALVSITLTTSKSLVVYGSSVTLSGTATDAPNQTIRIEGDGYPYSPTKFTQVAKVETDANGNFSVKIKPGINTAFFASLGDQRSKSLIVNVRPRVLVRHAGVHQFVIKALADKSLAGRIAIVQRWSPAKHLWISIRRVTLRGSLDQNGAVVAATSLTLRGFGGSTTRIYLPLKSVVPGYVSSTSSAFTA